MKFGHLEQKFALKNQKTCEKFFKNNAHIHMKIDIDDCCIECAYKERVGMNVTNGT
jgi:hypothetical protein